MTAPVRRRAPRTPTGRAKRAAADLAEAYPEAECELHHSNAFELLVATILSAQTTDARVNMVTPELFRRWPNPAALAAADPEELEGVVQSTGFFRAKARNLIGTAARLHEVYGGDVPPDVAELVTLPGVGRKTANVVRSVALGLPGFPVDTHVRRLTTRLGISASEDPVTIEREVNGMLPARALGEFSLRLILHGRRVCVARTPRCPGCLMNWWCPASSVRM